MANRTLKELEAGLDEILQSPQNHGVLELIVRRPQVDARESLDVAELNLSEGLVGDNWRSRGSRHTGDGSAHPDMQVTIVNSRLMSLLGGDKHRWQLAGDQLYVDLDLSTQNLPPGAHVLIGSAVMEISARPHTGCQEFATRYGEDAQKFVNSSSARIYRLRGANAKVVQSGVIRVGDTVYVSKGVI